MVILTKDPMAVAAQATDKARTTTIGKRMTMVVNLELVNRLPHQVRTQPWVVDKTCLVVDIPKLLLHLRQAQVSVVVDLLPQKDNGYGTSWQMEEKGNGNGQLQLLSKKISHRSRRRQAHNRVEDIHQVMAAILPLAPAEMIEDISYNPMEP